MVFWPPRHSKSETISHYTPAWWLGRFPDANIILASYGQDLADDWGRKARDTLDEYGAEVFGVKVSDDSAAAGRWGVEGHRGGFKAAGVGGSITGRGANLLIIDDPVKNETEAFSSTIHKRNIEWWASTASTRLEPDAVVILMMTRWHPNDLAGFLLGESEVWDMLVLPAIAEQDDPLGRQPGQALWPERYDETALAEIRSRQSRVLDGYYWQALFQQRPALPEGLLYFDKGSIEAGKAYAAANPPRERLETRPIPDAPADGYVLVWERPVTGERYYIGADTADGKGEVLGTLSATGGPDRNAAGIFRARDDVQVAEIYGRQEEHNYARILNQWGRAYNNALLCVERNRRAVLIALRELNYPNLYYTPKFGDMHLVPGVNPARQIEYGFNTDMKTRPAALSDLREAVSANTVHIKSAGFWEETESFLMGDKPEAAPGQHDDRIAYGWLAVQCRRMLRQAQRAVGGLTFMGGI